MNRAGGGGEEDETSIRSRASSVISTGTKFSVLTLPQSDAASLHPIDGVVLGSSAATAASAAAAEAATTMTAAAAISAVPRLVPRPMSLYSFRSVGEALPAYSESQDSELGMGRGEEEDANGERRRRRTVQAGEADDDDDDDEVETEDGTEMMQRSTTPTSMTNDRENSLSMHYGRVVRTIDENHARLIARKDAAHALEVETLRASIERLMVEHKGELAALRNEVDAVRNNVDAEYRKVLKVRNKEIERTREVSATRENELEVEIERLRVQVRDKDNEILAVKEGAKEEAETIAEKKEREVEGRCAKARHLVEDLWEERWQRRNDLAAEEAKRSEKEWRETIRILVEERDESWQSAVEVRYGLEEMRVLVDEVEKLNIKGREKS